MLRAIKKSDLKAFLTKPQDVCRIEDGNNNPFLKEERAVEEYLKEIEPRYNVSVQKLREDKMDQAAIHAIAGFVVYVIVCSPTGGRLHSKPVEQRLLIQKQRSSKRPAMMILLLTHLATRSFRNLSKRES